MTKQHTEPSEILTSMRELIAKQKRSLALSENLYRDALIHHYLGFPIGTDDLVVKTKPSARGLNSYAVHLNDDKTPITEISQPKLWLLVKAARDGTPMQLPADEIAKRFAKHLNFGGEV